MEIESKKTRSLTSDIKEAVEIIGDSIGTAASPSVFMLITLLNSTGKGRGFDGYMTNPIPIGANLTQNVYNGPKGQWIIYLVREKLPPNLWYAQNNVSSKIAGPFPTEDDAKKWIDQNG